MKRVIEEKANTESEQDQKLLRKEMKRVKERCKYNQYEEMRTRYAEFLEQEPVKEDHILYEAFSGRGMTCGPYAIFKYLMSKRKYRKYVHVWVIEDLEDNREIIQHYESYQNVMFVEYQSLEYRKYLATAKYLINNATFPGYFTKRKEQVFIDVWHGIPLKTLGFDIPGGNVSSGNSARNFLSADYLISPNAFMTDIYKNAFKMEGLYQGTILEIGQPRSDSYFHANRKEVIDKLQSCGVDVDPNKKIMMYAPTWKGTQYANPDTNLESYFELIKRVERNINTEEYQVLVKPHQIVYRNIKDRKEITGKFIPAIIDTDEILSVVDVMIADYSSIYFDYLISDKPILFYIPDVEEYKGYRGLYFGLEKLPGPIARTFEELEEMVADIDKAVEPYREKYQKEKQWACPNDDGSVCERLVKTVFGKRKCRQSVKCDTTSKKKLLLYGGKLITNGISNACIALLNNMDYEKFDVTVITLGAGDADVAERINSLPKEVRVLYRSATFNATLEEAGRHAMIMERGLDAGIDAPANLYRRELRRSIGMSKFDYVIEFTGYSNLFSVMFTYAEDAQKIIWMHSDLKRELSRAEHGGLDVGKVLKVCLSTYPYMDKIVGCSKTIMEINKRNFSSPELESRFTYARNLLRFERALEKEDDKTIMNLNGSSYYVNKLDESVPSNALAEIMMLPDESKVNYVTMGRLSPEKNYENLIRAFARLHRENQEARLYLLGDGPLRKKLENVIKEEAMDGIVHLMGNVAKPFSYLRRCNCFILPSYYEGQPLVVLEARILQMPIIISEFEAAKDVLMEHGQILTGQDIDSLYEGMKDFLEGKAPEYSFEYETYNHEVYQEFEKVLAM